MKKKLALILIIWIGLLQGVCAFPVFAETGGQTAEETLYGGAAAATGQAEGVDYVAKLYNAENGLPTSDANVIYSASDGFIWIGGYSGLTRYDGTSFERQDSTGGITTVNAIFEDSKGRLWIGTNDNGICFLQNGKESHFSYAEGLEASSVRTITEDAQGNILVGTTQGIYYLDQDLKVHLMGDAQIKNAYVAHLWSGPDGYIYGNTRAGHFFRIRELRVTEYYNGEDLGIGAVSAICPSRDNPDEVWLGTDFGLVCRGSFADGFAKLEKISLYYEAVEEDENDEDRYAQERHMELATDNVTQIGYAADRVWVCMNSKIFFADEKGKFTQLVDEPLNNSIDNMTEDWEGNLWFASTRQGIMKVAANKFVDISDRAGLESRVVNSTCMRDRTLYIATETGLQIMDREYRPVVNELTEYLGNARLRCLFLDREGNLWIATFTNELGVVCYTPEEEILCFTEDNGLPSNKIRCFAQAPDGAVLVATNAGLGVIRDGKVERVIDEASGLSNTVILTAEVDASGVYYLGTDGGGIYVVDGNNITHLFREDGLSSDVVMRIKWDEKRGVFWIVTSNSIEYMKNGVIKKVNAFPYTNNYDVYFDNGDNVWILASNGIYVANAEDMISKERFDYEHYSISSGLPSVPTGNSFSFLDDYGNLFISGRSGVSRVNIDNYLVQSQDIRFCVPYIESDDERFYPSSDNVFTLPSSARNITIYGYALTYRMHDPQIQYFLKGADKQPTVIDKSDMSPVRYTNLKGGEYEYQLSLIDGSTHTVRQTVTFRIMKQYAFYEELWFNFLCALVGLLFVALMIRLYLRHKTAVFIKREEEQKKLSNLFEQTATALVNAIDAKDKYTHGHSSRVADYSRKLAELAGKSKQECDEIYYAALLHDIGKIGVPVSIINKNGRLDDSEYEIIKQHPVTGAQILKTIKEYPYLSIAANYHHERYDGKGYPTGLKGKDIPELARIVSVADAYDAMTSKRSYRDPIPQQKVREEILKGTGTQFDPEYARLMLHLIDLDSEYEMKEREEQSELGKENELVLGERRSDASAGILLTSCMTTLRVRVEQNPEMRGINPAPSLLLFDSLDGQYHARERDKKQLVYFEYGELWFDGRTETAGARKIQTKTEKNAPREGRATNEYQIEAVRIKDHVMIRIAGALKTTEVIIALPDNVRYAYMGLTGEACRFTDLTVIKADEETPEHAIPRIAEAISYIDGPAGDLPNLQVDGFRAASTEGIQIKDGLEISFHTRSLPTARLVWHCAYIDIFASGNGRVDGPDYVDYILLRLDGEKWECDADCKSTQEVRKGEKFRGWDAWKEYNRQGFFCTVRFFVKDERIVVQTENFGIEIKTVLEIQNEPGAIYAALTGDQCVITDIRVKQR